MLEDNIVLKLLFDFFSKKNISNVLCPSSLSNFLTLKKMNVNIIEDTRSAAYVACGACATTQKPIVIFVNSDNESRNLLSGLTEAYYRNLPVIVVIIPNKIKLNYDNKINDAIGANYSLSDNMSKTLLLNTVNKINQAFLTKQFPILINCAFELSEEKTATERFLFNAYRNIVSKVCEQINSDYYLFIAQDVVSDNFNIDRPYHINSGAFSYDGVISTVLGASLANLHKRYCCILSYKDFIHDINTLGNRHFPKNITLYVISNKLHKTISDYCSSLNIYYHFTSDINSLSNNTEKDGSHSAVIELKIT